MGRRIEKAADYKRTQHSCQSILPYQVRFVRTERRLPPSTPNETGVSTSAGTIELSKGRPLPFSLSHHHTVPHTLGTEAIASNSDTRPKRLKQAFPRPGSCGMHYRSTTASVVEGRAKHPLFRPPPSCIGILPRTQEHLHCHHRIQPEPSTSSSVHLVSASRSHAGRSSVPRRRRSGRALLRLRAHPVSCPPCRCKPLDVIRSFRALYQAGL